MSTPRWYFNLFFVMLVCGLWHGANWTFIVWGGLHGFYLVFSAFTQKIRRNIRRTIGLEDRTRVLQFFEILVTFLLVTFAWIFFRANHISDALLIISKFFTDWGSLRNIPFFGSLRYEFMIGMASIAVLLLVHLMERRGSIVQIIGEKPFWLRWSVYYSTLLFILLFGNIGQKQFIYFQF